MAFNRPEVTKIVFTAIRAAEPLKLYIATDGPRKEKSGEVERCRLVQDIFSKIDWPCEVSFLVRKENLGCKRAVSSAIDWFFSHETEGIVLEDDCLPHLDFFNFCDELLEKYRDDERVGLITGTSFGDLRGERLVVGPEDFIFNRYPSIWGWASWRRVWRDYDVNIKDWKDYRRDISVMTPSLALRKRNDRLFDDVYNCRIDTWDYQVSFLLWSSARLAITPRINLVENIGFGPDATHTKSLDQINSNRIKMSTDRLRFPLIAPRIFAANYDYQNWIERYATRSIFTKVFYKLKKYADKK